MCHAFFQTKMCTHIYTHLSQKVRAFMGLISQLNSCDRLSRIRSSQEKWPKKSPSDLASVREMTSFPASYSWELRFKSPSVQRGRGGRPAVCLYLSTQVSQNKVALTLSDSNEFCWSSALPLLHRTYNFKKWRYFRLQY